MPKLKWGVPAGVDLWYAVSGAKALWVTVKAPWVPGWTLFNSGIENRGSRLRWVAFRAELPSAISHHRNV